MGQGPTKAAGGPVFVVDPRIEFPAGDPVDLVQLARLLTPRPLLGSGSSVIASAVLNHHARRSTVASTARQPTGTTPRGSTAAAEARSSAVSRTQFIELVAAAMGAAPTESGATASEGLLPTDTASASTAAPTAEFWTLGSVTDPDGVGLIQLLRFALAVAGAPHERAEELVSRAVLHRKRTLATLPLPPADQRELLGAWVTQHCPGFFDVLLRGWVEALLLPTAEKGGPAADGREGAGAGSEEAAVAAWSKLRPFGLQCALASEPVWGGMAALPTARMPNGDPVTSSVLTDCSSPAFVSAMLPPVFRAGGAQEWVLLYTSTSMGKGATRLAHHVFKYPGPTVLVALAADDSVYAMAVDVDWHDGSNLWGGDACRALVLAPGLAQASEEVRMNFNTRSRNGSRGLGMVATKTGKKLLWMDSDFSGSHRAFGDQCAPGLLAESTVVRFEVWGCGGIAAFDVQQSRNSVGRGIQERAGKAKRPDWGTDRDLLVMAGTNAGRHIVNGEAGRIGHDDDDDNE